mmetsp:Transcript_6784/g.10767  ORF Transcript_6784/g.10767 Transcript_6784/m.10767 type:complete len:757 (-) Transcript_6784:247-2517(-)
MVKLRSPFGRKKKDAELKEKLVEEENKEAPVEEEEEQSHPDLLVKDEAPPGKDSFQDENGYSWDMVMFFPESPEAKAEQRATEDALRGRVATALHRAGVETYLYWSAQRDEVVAKLRCPVARLREYADATNYKFLLDEDAAMAACTAGRPGFFAGFEINPDPSISKLSPYEFIYGAYVNSEELVDPALYRRGEGLGHPFAQVHRIKLMEQLVNDALKTLYPNCSWRVLQHKKDILAFFPLHNDKDRKALKEAWIPGAWRRLCMFGRQPLTQIRGYLGAKIAMYFAFMEHYTKWLVSLSILGLVLFAWSIKERTLSSSLLPSAGVFVAFWAVLLLEYWKRKEVRLAMEWGMTDFEEAEKDRPEFKGDIINSYIDGKPMLYFPKEKLQTRRRISRIVISTFIVCVLICVICIFIFKSIMKHSSNTIEDTYYSPIASGLNAIQIQIFNIIYSTVSVWLNNAENFRTDTEYEDGLVAKTFAFQFVNSYATFYYTAFAKPVWEGCDYGYLDEYNSCMYDVAYSLAIIFGTRVVMSQITNVLIPRMKAKKRMKAELAGTEGKVLSQPETEYVLEPYDAMMGVLGDYAELSIQFGYVTLFVVAFPLAPLLAWLANYIEIGSDGQKLLYEHQRAMPTGNQDIGTWQAIFGMLSSIAVVTNAALVAFTTGMLAGRGWSTTEELWAFVLAQYAVFGMMALFSYVVEDVPEPVTTQIARSEFIISKVIDKVPDEDDDEETSILPKDQRKTNIHAKDDDKRTGHAARV